MDASYDVAHSIVVMSYMDTSSDVAHDIMVTSYMDMSSDVAYAIVVTSHIDMSDFGIKHGGVKLKTIKLVFAVFPLSTQL
jgi:hypothetical protein